MNNEITLNYDFSEIRQIIEDSTKQICTAIKQNESFKISERKFIMDMVERQLFADIKVLKEELIDKSINQIIDNLKVPTLNVSVIDKQELKAMIDEVINNSSILKDMKVSKDIPPESLIYGIKGLASFLNVTQPTAQKWKKEGVFPYVQRGRTIIFKSDEVLAGMKRSKPNHKIR